MPFNFRNAFVSNAFPKDRALLLVDGVDLPGVLRIVFDRSDVAEETVARFVLCAADGRRHEYLVAPDDGTRMSKARNRGFPTNIGLGRTVELHRLRRAFGDAGCARTTKLRPVLRLGHNV